MSPKDRATVAGAVALRDLFKSKIHRLRVTGADVDYEGSITRVARTPRAGK